MKLQSLLTTATTCLLSNSRIISGFSSPCSFRAMTSASSSSLLLGGCGGFAHDDDGTTKSAKLAAAATTASAPSPPPSSSSCWEVEQKFAIPDPDALCQKLVQAGLELSSNKSMVDWYFDVPSLNYPLIRQDCWLRCRYQQQQQQLGEEAAAADCDGQPVVVWELKRGVKDKGDSGGNAKATAYEEIQGEEALKISREMIANYHQAAEKVFPNNKIVDHDDLFDNHKIPVAPIEIKGMMPLARIATQRSSWRSTIASSSSSQDWHQQQGENDGGNNDINNNMIAVDLDTTDFGHAVGEVEMLVTDQSQIQTARQTLQEWLDKVLGNDDDDDEQEKKASPAMGKLEFYLATKRPDVYEILVDAGLMASR